MIGKTVNTDLVIIGGGPAGLAAAISAREAGADKVTILKNWIFLVEMENLI